MNRKWVVLVLFVIGATIFTSQGLKGGPEVTVQEAVALLNTTPRPVLIDVRERAVYEQGHIAGAISVPSAEFKERLEQLKLSKVDPIVVYGTDDVRVREATKQLYQSGHQGALTLMGGFDAWRAAGQPVTKKP